MNNTLKKVAIGVGGIFIVLGVIIFSVLYTPPGRGILISTILPYLEDAVGSEIEIGSVRGPLPNVLIIENATLTDNETPWLSVDRLEARWRPLAMLSGEAIVEFVDIQGVNLTGPPPSEEEQSSPSPLGGPTKPTNLPKLKINRFQFSNVTIGSKLIGHEVTLNGEGYVRIGPRLIDINAIVLSSDERDRLNVLATLDPSTNSMRIDSELLGQETGAIAALLKSDGPIHIKTKGDAPLDNFDLNASGSIGEIASMEARITGDFSTLDNIGTTFFVKLGDKHRALRDQIGEEFSANLVLGLASNGGELIIQSMNSKLAKATGTLRWLNKNNVISSLNLDTSVSFTSHTPENFVSILGENAAFSLDLSPAETFGSYRLNFSGTTKTGKILFSDAKTDFSSFLQGPLLVQTQAIDENNLPALTLAANADFKYEEAISLSNVEVTLENEKVFAGDTSYQFVDGRIQARGRLESEPALLDQYLSFIEFTDALNADLKLEGTTSEFALSVTGEIPTSQIDGATAPASTLAINLSNLPYRPNGTLKFFPKTGDGGLSVSLETDENEKISARTISYTGEGFSLKGDGSYERSAERGDVRLAYTGDPEAEPWPGVPLAGEFNLTSDFDLTEERISFVLRIPNLNIATQEIEDLNLLADGTLSAVETTLSMKSFTPPSGEGVEDLNINLLPNFIDRDITIKSANANYLLTSISANRPFKIGLNDGLSVEGASFAIGENGVAQLNGHLSSKRWLAKIVLEKVTPPGYDVVSDFTIDLDTDRKEDIAQGVIALSSPLISDATAPVSANLTWDGVALLVTDRENPTGLNLDVSFPMLLNREEALSISTEGPLSGALSFKGRAESLMTFVPGPMESLEGDLDFSVKLGGTLAAPNIDGLLEMENGAYTESQSGVSITNISSTIRANSIASGAEYSFTMDAAGHRQNDQSIHLEGNGQIGEDSRIDATLTLDGAAFSANLISNARASGVLTLNGPMDALQAAGDVTINELNLEVATPPATGLVNIDVVELIDAKTTTATAISSNNSQATSPIALDLNINAPQALFVRGRGLDSEWRTNLKISGTSALPLITGDIQVRRGTIDFAGRRFDLTNGEISFNRLTQNNPTLNLRAEYETDESVVAAIVVGGRAMSPAVSLESAPSLPQEDIMALVLFGKPANQLSAFESLQIAQALSQLGGFSPLGGGLGATDQARSALGLDMLNLDLDSATGSSSLTVGKYVADGLFVSATQSARGDEGAVRVEYELSDSFTIETELKQDGDQTVSANWKKDF